MSSKHRLAQLNVAHARAPLDDPMMAGFVSRIDGVNALAESSPGFIWRLKGPEGDIAWQVFGNPLYLVNLSLWESPAHLRDFVYRGDHMTVMRQRKEWFERFEGACLALWWVPAGHVPTVQEAKERLLHLQEHGPSARVFTFAKLFPAPDEVGAGPTTDLSAACPAL